MIHLSRTRSRRRSLGLLLAGALLLSLLQGCPGGDGPLGPLADVPPAYWALYASGKPGQVTTHDPALAYEGLTVVQDSEHNKVVVIDMEGTVIKSYVPWDPVYDTVSYAKPLDGGLLLLYPSAPRVPEWGFFSPRILALLDENADLLFEWNGKPGLERLHHDFWLLESGNLMALASPDPDTVWAGISTNPVQDDLIFEIDRASGGIVWSWSTADHYDQLPFTMAQRALMADQTIEDVFHTNSFQILPANPWNPATYPEFAPGNILVGQRETNFVFIIDAVTGDIVWTLDHDTIGNIGQHAPHMIPTGLPGAGNILLFDNGCCGGLPRVTRGYSRVLEINPATQSIAWSYDPAVSFYSAYRGGVQRLPNGNTLVVSSNEARVFEVTAAGEIVWEFQMPMGKGPYRAHRVDATWLAGGATGPVPFPW